MYRLRYIVLIASALTAIWSHLVVPWPNTLWDFVANHPLELTLSYAVVIGVFVYVADAVTLVTPGPESSREGGPVDESASVTRFLFDILDYAGSFFAALMMTVLFVHGTVGRLNLPEPAPSALIIVTVILWGRATVFAGRKVRKGWAGVFAPKLVVPEGSDVGPRANPISPPPRAEASHP